MEYVKRSLIGYREAQGGFAGEQCTHVVLLKDEYKGLLDKVANSEQRARDIERKSKEDIYKIEAEARCAAQEAATAASRDIASMKTLLEAETAEKELQQRLNANLLRISKERANADRKLMPKKVHLGYTVLSSEQKEQRYSEAKALKKCFLWETSLQSPYSSALPEDIARALINKDLLQKDGLHLIFALGISGYYCGSYDDMMRNPKIDKQMNIALNLRLKQNFRTGYWELYFLHVKPLAEVPKNMRAREAAAMRESAG